MLDKIINDFCSKNELKKSDDDYIVNDDTQVGIEFAYEQIDKAGMLINDNAINYLKYMHPEAYKGFLYRLNKKQ